MRHILMLAMILGLTLGFASVSHAKDEVNPDAGATLCDPKTQSCDEGDGKDDGKGGSEEPSGTWHGYKAGSKELEQEKAKLDAIKASSSQEAQDWLDQNRKARELVVQGKK
jgi:hypothetical protein